MGINVGAGRRIARQRLRLSRREMSLGMVPISDR
jgi:hypothetical protein